MGGDILRERKMYHLLRMSFLPVFSYSPEPQHTDMRDGILSDTRCLQVRQLCICIGLSDTVLYDNVLHL